MPYLEVNRRPNSCPSRMTSSGYIEILQDIDGATLEEAHAILQEISHVRREKNWETVRLF